MLKSKGDFNTVMIHKLTMQDKRKAIDKFLEDNNAIESNGEGFAFWSSSKGIYSGFSRGINHKYDKDDTFFYYGFVIDFGKKDFWVEGLSGKRLKNNPSTLDKAFLFGKYFDNHYSELTENEKVFNTMGKILGADIYTAEEPNFGRGIYRGITEFPLSEHVIKEVKHPEALTYNLLSIICEGDQLINSDEDNYNSNNNLEYPSNRVSKSFKKSFHGSKHLWNILINSDNCSDMVRIVRLSCYADYEQDNQESFIDGKAFPVLKERIQHTGKIIDQFYDICKKVDKERGYHDAQNWFTSFYTYLEDNNVDNFRYLLKKIGNDKQSFKNFVRYSYASLYHQQAFDSFFAATYVLKDYYKLIDDFPNAPLYPRYLKVAHDVASRNYKAFVNTKTNQEIYQIWLKSHSQFEYTCGDYVITQAASAKEIVEEGTNNSNCVAGYVGSVKRGTSIILFLRKKEDPLKSWVTIELRPSLDGYTIVQSFETFDNPLTNLSQNILAAWCRKCGIKLNKDVVSVSTSDWDTRRIHSKFLPIKDEKLALYHTDDLNSLEDNRLNYEKKRDNATKETSKALADIKTKY